MPRPDRRRPRTRDVAYTLRSSGGSLYTVRGGRLTAARAALPPVIDLGPGRLFPGLINAHDHLQLNHYPRLGRPPYGNAYQWGKDIHARFARDIRRAGRLPQRYAYLFGALKNLLGGVTTVVHHDPWHPILNGTFPLRVARVRVAHSLGFERNWTAALAGTGATRIQPLSLHVAEGVDAVARGEVRECERRGLVGPRLLAVHLVAADRDDARRLRRAGAGVVWCPTSNLFLFGRTLGGALLTRGPDLLIGTDSLLTARGTMLDELRTARARARGRVSERRLRAAVGLTAARRLGLPVPRLRPGAPADLVLLRRPLFQARPRDVRLVIVDGRPRLGDPAFAPLFAHCGVRVERLQVGGTTKLVAAPLATAARWALAVTPEAGRILR